MATLRSTIALYDGMSAPLRNMNQAVRVVLDGFEALQSAGANALDPTVIRQAREELNRTDEALNELGSGIRRAEEQQQRLNQNLGEGRREANRVRESLDMEDEIRHADEQQRRLNTDLEHGRNAAENLRDSLENGSDAAENLRDSLDIEETIRRAEEQQQRLNDRLREGRDAAEDLRRSQNRNDSGGGGNGNPNPVEDNGDENAAEEIWSRIKNIAATIGGAEALKQIVAVSDQLTSANARLNLIVDDGGSVEELEKKIMASAQRSRSAYFDVASSVASLASNAGAAFSGNDEIIAFMEQVNKQFVIGGASAEGQAAAMLQLTQAMAAGALRGEELNSILENAPGIARAIEQYMGIAQGSIKSVAEEGQVTADVVKNALFSVADETNAKFESMPMTWSQIWTSMKNQMLSAFSPALKQLNDMMNSLQFQQVISGIINALSILATVAAGVFDVLVHAGSFVVDNWSWIAPILLGVASAFLFLRGAAFAYNAVTAIGNALETIRATRLAISAASASMAAGATFRQTVAQHGLNAALLACPLARIILLIIALIAIIYAAASAVAKFTGVANTGFGIITGGINVVIQFFKNLGLTVANIALGIGQAIAALAHNIVTAFQNAIANVQTFFYNLLSTALNVISKIAGALNKLPFVNIDVSGLSASADAWAQKAQNAQDSKGTYENIGDAFSKGFNTFDTYQSGWASDAFAAGSAWGDSVASKVSGLLDFSKNDPMGAGIPDSLSSLQNLIPEGSGGNGSPAAFDTGNTLDDISGSSGDTAENTAAMRNSLSASETELKYLREIAEREAINRFTTAELNITMNNNNTISGTDDIDGIITALEVAAQEAMIEVSEGAHI